jgi:hypothetical protein
MRGVVCGEPRDARCDAVTVDAVMTMKRHVFAFDSMRATQAAIAALRAADVDEERISLIARSEVQEKRIPKKLLDAGTDFAPAIVRGAVVGSAVGLAAGIIVLLIPAFGIPASAAALLGFLAGGAVIGAWTQAIVGSGLPDPIREKFDDEIQAGRILLVVDGDAATDLKIRKTLAEAGDAHLVWQSKVRAAKF